MGNKRDGHNRRIRPHCEKNSGINHKCDVHHDAPAVFFSTGGYTGNLYHEFNDGILPLYITSQHLNKKDNRARENLSSFKLGDVMIGVHGAAMTHFLFMNPGSVFIQVVPLGTDWAAETYYGEPAGKFGLRYIGYKILPKESSLYDDYNENDPILMDPSSVNRKGWEFTKKIYLDRQTVRLDLRRFQKRLLRAYYYTLARKNGRLRHGSE
ncbi:hypothetical protein DH2020_016659 [Rehmannia glutinosa]|uniref:Uncharacterized protein n=1 Tax=Rehmannia glutinosa TaxID=99300 RepID=A0ABR0WSG6_REHGL